MMTKTLFIATAMSAVALCAQAAPEGIKLTEPVEVAGAAFSNISPEGRYALSWDPETLIVYDLQDGEAWLYAGDGVFSEYSAGLGQPFSANGIMVGSTTVANTASYWEKGEWKSLPMPESWKGAIARGINRDASVICGTANPEVSGPSTDAVVSAVPCIWKRKADGTYDMPVLLPYPKLDFTGRVPQYVTALTVSADGKSILGQVRDFSGVATAPILFTCNDQGEWSYNYFGADLVNPDRVEFPEWVEGDSLVPPVATDFMDADQRARYEQAVTDWNNGGMVEGQEPKEQDYMTAEKWAEYNKALEDYNAKLVEIGEKQTAFFEVFYSVMEKGMQFLFNNQYANADGTIFTTTRQVVYYDEDSGEDVTVYSPYRFKIASDGKISYERLGEGYQVTDITDDGTVLLVHSDGEVPPTALIAPIDGEVMPIEKYVAARNENLGKWIVDNMTHTLTTVMGVSDDFLITGFPHASADLKIFSCATENYWDLSDSSPFYFGYLFGIDMKVDGVEAVAETGAATVKALRGGRLEVSGTADIDIYSAAGVLLYRANGVSGSVDTGVSGLVLIKTVDEKGNTATVKALL